MRMLRNVFVFTFIACVFVSCTSPQPLDNSTQPPKVAFTAAELLEKHNIRAAQLDQFHAYGVVEINWIDDQGKHNNQGDAELWIDQPHKTALRIDKVSDVLLWLGSNDTYWWLFDMLNKPTTLHSGSIADAAGRFNVGEIVSVHPLTLLDLLGITPLEKIEDEGAYYDSEKKQWTLKAAGPNAPLQLTFDASARLISIEALNENNQTIATSELKEYESVKRVGVNPLNWPKVATHITITLADQGGSVLLALNKDMDSAIDEVLAERVFDLEAIKTSLRPERVVNDGK